MTLQEALKHLAELKCSDGYCYLGGEAKGMHTNGGCKCLHDIRSVQLRARIGYVLMEARKAGAVDGLTPTVEPKA